MLSVLLPSYLTFRFSLDLTPVLGYNSREVKCIRIFGIFEIEAFTKSQV